MCPNRNRNSIAMAKSRVVSVLEWQAIIRENIVAPSCKLPLWQMSSGGSRLMKASEIDGCVCCWYRNCHCVYGCVCVLVSLALCRNANLLATRLKLTALWSDCGSNLCFNFSSLFKNYAQLAVPLLRFYSYPTPPPLSPLPHTANNSQPRPLPLPVIAVIFISVISIVSSQSD